MTTRAKGEKDLKKFFSRLKRTCPKASLYESSVALEHLLFAVLSEDNSPVRAKTALNRLLAHAVDFNDLRVSTPEELAGIIGKDLPDAHPRAAGLIRVLNAVYAGQNEVSLEQIKSSTKKEARAYLAGLDGITPYVLASTMLWAFGEHNIPVDRQILEALKKEQVISDDADVQSAQGFLKRHVSAGDGPLFATLLKRYAAQKVPRRTLVARRRKPARR